MSAETVRPDRIHDIDLLLAGHPDPFVPNPEAGTRTEFWGLIGCSGFGPDAECLEDDYGSSRRFEPTHWAPALTPP